MVLGERVGPNGGRGEVWHRTPCARPHVWRPCAQRPASTVRAAPGLRPALRTKHPLHCAPSCPPRVWKGCGDLALHAGKLSCNPRWCGGSHWRHHCGSCCGPTPTPPARYQGRSSCPAHGPGRGQHLVPRSGRGRASCPARGPCRERTAAQTTPHRSPSHPEQERTSRHGPEATRKRALCIGTQPGVRGASSHREVAPGPGPVARACAQRNLRRGRPGVRARASHPARGPGGVTSRTPRASPDIP